MRLRYPRTSTSALASFGGSIHLTTYSNQHSFIFPKNAQENCRTPRRVPSRIRMTQNSDMKSKVKNNYIYLTQFVFIIIFKVSHFYLYTSLNVYTCYVYSYKYRARNKEEDNCSSFHFITISFLYFHFM